MPDSRIYRTWLQRIHSGSLTKSQINTLANYRSGGGRRNNLTPDELDRLMAHLTQAVENNEIEIGEEQTREGLAWLQRHVWRMPWFAADVVRNFSHFEFRGFAHIESNPTRVAHHPRSRSTYRPRYRVVGRNGRWFDYVVTANRSDFLSGGQRLRSPVGVLDHGIYVSGRGED